MSDTIQAMGVNPFTKNAGGFVDMPDPGAAARYPKFGGAPLSLIPQKRPPRMVPMPQPGQDANVFRAQQQADAVDAYNALRERMTQTPDDLGATNQQRAEKALREMYPGAGGIELVDRAERAWGVPQGSMDFSIVPQRKLQHGDGWKEQGNSNHLSRKIVWGDGSLGSVDSGIFHELHHIADHDQEPGFFLGPSGGFDWNQGKSGFDAFGDQPGHFANGFNNRNMAESLEAQNIHGKSGEPYPDWLLQKYPFLSRDDGSNVVLPPASPRGQRSPWR